MVGDEVSGQSIEIIGNAGSSMFERFQTSTEYCDGNPDPMDRWTKARIGSLAKVRHLDVIFPFEGPPFFPFQQWAMRADPAFYTSPLGILVHQRYGLWTGLRAALIHPRPAPLATGVKPSHPCESCRKKPCLTACPVDAFKADPETFTPEVYEARACVDHIASSDLMSCRSQACAARRACPLGRGYALSEDQARFHMNAFVTANHSAA